MSIFSLKVFLTIHSPVFTILLIWLVFFIILVKQCSGACKIISFNIASILFLLISVESFCYLSFYPKIKEGKMHHYEGSYNGEYFQRDTILGYGPMKDTIISSKKFYNGQMIYDVHYTILKNGLRITPRSHLACNDECIFFFGGSYTFGEGVNDSSSMPYIVGLHQDKKVHNLGFHGYGPQQMLAAIENRVIDCNPALAIYQALPSHIGRASGFSSYDRNGPKYTFQNGILKHSGKFSDKDKDMRYSIKKLKNSYFYQKYFGKDRYRNADENTKLYLEIVNAAKNKLESYYSDIEFHVILWDNDLHNQKSKRLIIDGLKKRKVNYHLLTDIISDINNNHEKYTLSSNDSHPNYYAHKIIAQYIIESLITSG